MDTSAETKVREGNGVADFMASKGLQVSTLRLYALRAEKNKKV